MKRTTSAVHALRILTVMSQEPAGELTAESLYQRLASEFGHLLNPVDLAQAESDEQKHNTRQLWEIRAGATKKYLRQRNWIEDTPRGIWRISPVGRAVVAESKSTTASNAAKRRGKQLTYGEIPGYPPGSAFADRREAFDAGIHRQLQAGIAGQAAGTQSICLSDGYSDDDVQGDLITYTGFGGRDANTGRHVADQKLEQGNLGLVENYSSGRPVRVLVKVSVLTGQRADSDYMYLGLYKVTGWSWGTRDGYKVLIYQLRASAGESILPEEASAALARGDDAPTTRRETTVNRIVRNYDVAASVKRLYDHTCQFCGLRLMTAAGPYSQAAHIRPLGIPHNGPDTLDNLLCLCPNCHTQFDGHALTVEPDGTLLIFEVPNGSSLRINSDHRINFDHFSYHSESSHSESTAQHKLPSEPVL